MKSDKALIAKATLLLRNGKQTESPFLDNKARPLRKRPVEQILVPGDHLLTPFHHKWPGSASSPGLRGYLSRSGPVLESYGA